MDLSHGNSPHLVMESHVRESVKEYDIYILNPTSSFFFFIKKIVVQ